MDKIWLTGCTQIVPVRLKANAERTRNEIFIHRAEIFSAYSKKIIKLFRVLPVNHRYLKYTHLENNVKHKSPD
jgi:hypothetical protein